MARDRISEAAAQKKVDRQIDHQKRLSMMENAITDARWGRIWNINNNGEPIDYNRIADEIISAAALS